MTVLVYIGSFVWRSTGHMFIQSASSLAYTFKVVHYLFPCLIWYDKMIWPVKNFLCGRSKQNFLYLEKSVQQNFCLDIPLHWSFSACYFNKYLKRRKILQFFVIKAIKFLQMSNIAVVFCALKIYKEIMFLLATWCCKINRILPNW